MVQPGLGSALDTPRTALGDATYLDQQPDFADISQEATFISPSKDGNNLLQQMRNGGRSSLRTPRQREPFADRRNLPQSIGGAEFTPLLKSATRNSTRRGKTSKYVAPATPALNRIEEDDLTPLPQKDASMYTGSRNQSYLDNTLPQVDTSSPAPTPLAMQTRRDTDKGPLQDGNGLSLREQENVVNKMEKENFGLKLKIHFLEEALRKAGPGFSEAALKENTELKVDKVTMQRELHKYKKHLTGAEKDLQSYRQQLEDLQAKAMRKGSEHGLEEARRKTEQLVSQHEEEVQVLKQKIEEAGSYADLEGQLEQLKEQKATVEEELEDARYEARQEVEQLETEHDKAIAKLKRELDEAGHSEDLEAQIEELKEAKVALEEDLEDARYEARQEAEKTATDHEKEIARLKRQIEEAGQAGDLEAQIEELKERKATLEEDLEDARYEARQEIEKLSTEHEKEVADLQRQVEDAGSSEELEAQLDEVRQQKADLEEDLEELRRQGRREVDDLEAEHEREVLKLQRQVKEASSAPELEARIQTLENEKKAQEQDFNSQIQDIKKQKVHFEEDQQFKLQRLEDKKHAIEEELQGRIQVLEEEKVALEEDFEDAHRQVDEINAEHEREVQGLKRQLIGNESTVRDLQLQIQDLEDQKFTLEADLKESRHHADDITAKHDREIAQVKRQIIEGSNSSQDVQKQLKDLEAEKTSLRAEVKEARRQAEEAKTQHERAVQDLKRQLKTAGSANDDQSRDLEDQKISLENDLKTAHQQAERAASQHDRTVRDLKRRLDNAGSSSEQVQQLENEKLDLVEELENARRQAERASSQHEQAIRNLNRRLELKTSAASTNEEVQELEDQKLALEDTLEDTRRRAERANSQHERSIRDLQRRLELKSVPASVDKEVQELEDQKVDLEEALDETRRQLETVTSQHERTIRDMKRRLELKPTASNSGEEMQELEDQKSALEEALEEARRTAETSNSQHERAMRDMKRRLELKSTTIPSADRLQELEDQKLAMEEALEASRQQAEQTATEHQRAIRDLRRQVTTAGSSDTKLHDLEDQKLMLEEILEEARQQAESTAAQHKAAVADLKRQIQEAASSQDQLHDLEDEKIVLEEALEEVEEARQQAEETAAQHERAMRATKRKLEKAERDLKAAQSSHKSERHLLKSQAEMDNLEHDVRQQQETIDALMASEGSLRRKLERARSERAAYRMSAEKLQRDLSRAQKTQKTPSPVKNHMPEYGSDEAITTVVRAAEGAEERHTKEIRGMVTQMEWMQKRWEREASLRSDAAYAKRYLQLQLNVANACNKAQLRELEDIRTNLLGSRKSLTPLPSTLQKQKHKPQESTGKPKLKTFLIMARCVARMKISAREWQKQEMVKQKLVKATEESRRQKMRGKLQVVRNDERVLV